MKDRGEGKLNRFAYNNLIIFVFSVLLIVGYALCFPSTSVAQGLEIRVSGADTLVTRPGRILTLSFMVSYAGPIPLDFIEEIKLPEGWRTLMPLGSFQLAPGGRTLRIVPVQVPPSSRAGNFKVEYSLHGRERPDVRDTETVRIQVVPLDKLQLFLVQKPSEFIPGQTYSLTFQAVNGGNTPCDFVLRTGTAGTILVAMPEKRFSLDPGETALIELDVSIPADTVQPSQSFTLSAIDAEGNRLATLFVPIDTILATPDTLDLYHSLSSYLEIQNSWDGTENPIQLHWYGSGYMDEEKTRYVEFSFQGPDTSDSGRFGREDEYWLNYADEDSTFRLGDQTFGVSRLTSQYQYGRGAEVEYHPSQQRYRLGVYHFRSRWSDPEEQETGAFLAQELGKDAEMQFNYVEKEDRQAADGSLYTDQIYSLSSFFPLGDSWEVEGEYGWSKTSEPILAPKDWAYRVQVRGSPWRNMFFTGTKIHAEPDFFGEYNDYDYWGGTLGIPLSTATLLVLQHSTYESNLYPELNTELDRAPKEVLSRGYVDFTLPQSWHASIGYDCFKNEDRLLPRNYHYRESSWWLRLGRSLDTLSWEARVRYGEQEDLLNQSIANLWNYSFYLNWALSPTTLFSLYGIFGDDSASEDGTYLLSDSGEWGASLAWQASPRLGIELWYTKNGFNDDEEPVQDQYNLRTHYVFPNEHKLRFEYQRHDSENSDTKEYFLLSYLIPIKIRLQKKRDIGGIVGQVFNAEDPAMPPMADVVLICGNQKVRTDSQGRFTFSDLPFGTYLLQIDPDSIEKHQTPSQRFPLPVAIDSNEPVEINIEIVIGGTVKGKVFVERETGGNVDMVETHRQLTDGQGLGSILVEISRDSTVLRRLTESDGTFRFQRIPSGHWTLKVYDHNLPENMRLENPQMGLTLEGGQEIDIPVKVIIQKRKIHMLQLEKKILSVE